MRRFADAIRPNFVLLAITIQDPCYQVRMVFVNKLVALLTARRLHVAYNVIPFLSIHDPEADVISLNKAYIMHAVRVMPKGVLFAACVQGVVLMLVQRCGLSISRCCSFACCISLRTTPTLPSRRRRCPISQSAPATRHLSCSQLTRSSRYIDFYLDMVCTSENISLLYHLAAKLKTVRDPEGHTYSEVRVPTTRLESCRADVECSTCMPSASSRSGSSGTGRRTTGGRSRPTRARSSSPATSSSRSRTWRLGMRCVFCSAP